MSNMAFLLMIMIISSSILTSTLVCAHSKAELLDVVYIQRMDQAHIANSHHSSNDRFFRMYIVDGQTLYGPPVRPYLIKVLGLIRSAQLLLFGSNGFRLPDAHST